MSYIKDWDIKDIQKQIRKCSSVIHDPYNDGFVQSTLKQELYVLKCWLEDRYKECPKFVGEEKWEQERMIEILKR